MIHKIPQPVQNIIKTLNKAGFEAFTVGGCVRDLILEREPKDWDITTDALPEEVMKLFPNSFYENDFGTVGVKVERFSAKSRASVEGSQKINDQPIENNKYDIIEITTYRVESEYTDKRRPKEVLFTKSLEEDLARRDFTINAIAYGSRSSSTSPSRLAEAPSKRVQGEGREGFRFQTQTSPESPHSPTPHPRGLGSSPRAGELGERKTSQMCKL